MVRTFCCFATSTLFAQTVAPALGGTEAGALVGQLERVSLVGVLVMGILVLWRAYSRKDEQVLELSKAMLGALTANTDVMKELRGAVEALKAERRAIVPFSRGSFRGVESRG